MNQETHNCTPDANRPHVGNYCSYCYRTDFTNVEPVKYYCTFNGHQLDMTVGYCTDCMRLDCAVTADQLIDFKVGV